MDIGKRAYSLVTALVLGAAIVGLTADSAAAEEKTTSKDDGTRCAVVGAAVGTSNDYEFYMPGESYTDRVTGTKHVCGEDGEWTAMRTTNPRVPGQLPLHPFQPAP